ncbi:MAG: hypothetical protein U1F66_04045 [bacterium]
MSFLPLQRPVSGGPIRPGGTEGPVFSASEALARPLALASGAARAELLSLAVERDPQLFGEALLNFGMRQEQAGRLDLAAQAYAALEGPAFLGPLQPRARRRLDALFGRGAAGERAEFLLRRLAQEASDPAALFAMGAAGTVFRVARVAALSRLALSPSANLLTRGFGARAVAGLAAFSLEAPAFTVASRLGQAALGRDLDGSASAWGRDLASSYLVLGGLKFTGWLGGAAVRRLGSGNPNSRLLPALIQQGGMLTGIMLGHRLENLAGLRPQVDGATQLVDSLATLLQFNLAGRLSRAAFGPRFAAWEAGLDARTELISRPGPQGDFPGEGIPALALAGPSPRRASGSRWTDLNSPVLMMQIDAAKPGVRADATPLPLPKMGVRPRFEGSTVERLNRDEAARQLRELLPQEILPAEAAQDPQLVARLLTAFGVTSHGFDIAAFQKGHEIASHHPERVARLAFDIDEVYLHWAFSPTDLFQGMLEKGAETVYRNTDPSLLDYEPFQTSPQTRLNFFERLWFQGIQTLFPGRFRQHLQFHPGVRAFQLGLRLGQGKNLIMATTGPAGRILRLANEDPAMRMIYFGKGPEESVSIAEVRQGLNIYTREDLVLAMRAAVDGEIRYPEQPWVENYLEKVRQFPDRGVKLKHPALSLLRGKRAFDTLVDDSGSTFEMLGDLPNFSVLQPPSARPALTLNFTLGSINRYLRRSANGYVEELGRLLAGPERPASHRLSSAAAAPANYPFQRFTLEIPWRKFGAEFVAPNRELRQLGETLSRALPPPAASTANSAAPLSLSEADLQRLGDRLFREMELMLDRRPGEVAVESIHTLMYRDLAQNSPEDFQALLERHFSAEELAQLPQERLPAAERGTKFFSRVASLMAVKKSVCQLLALDPAEHSREVGFRFGQPLLRGKAAERLGTSRILATLADDGEVGVGLALMEPSPWASGVVGIGVDVTTDRVQYTRPAQHALAEAAYKATFPTHPIRRFTQYRAQEIAQRPDGTYILTGRTMQAARELRGDSGIQAPLEVPALHFRIGQATVALVAIPALGSTGGGGGLRQNGAANDVLSGEPPPLLGASPTYRRGPEGHFELPRRGMTVAVLGDIGGVRTFELARSGHYPVHIERDGDMLEMAERLFAVNAAEAGLEARSLAGGRSFLQGDWYDTAVNGDRVEAYFPLHSGDVPPRNSPNRGPAMDLFLQRALLSKLGAGGAGFVISEVRPIIEDLARAVLRRPDLELEEVVYDRQRLPLVGGFAAGSYFREPSSWLTFRRRS